MVLCWRVRPRRNRRIHHRGNKQRRLPLLKKEDKCRVAISGCVEIWATSKSRLPFSHPLTMLTSPARLFILHISDRFYSDQITPDNQISMCNRTIPNGAKRKINKTLSGITHTRTQTSTHTNNINTKESRLITNWQKFLVNSPYIIEFRQK